MAFALSVSPDESLRGRTQEEKSLDSNISSHQPSVSLLCALLRLILRIGRKLFNSMAKFSAYGHTFGVSEWVLVVCVCVWRGMWRLLFLAHCILLIIRQWNENVNSFFSLFLELISDHFSPFDILVLVGNAEFMFNHFFNKPSDIKNSNINFPVELKQTIFIMNGMKRTYIYFLNGSTSQYIAQVSNSDAIYNWWALMQNFYKYFLFGYSTRRQFFSSLARKLFIHPGASTRHLKYLWNNIFSS